MPNCVWCVQPLNIFIWYAHDSGFSPKGLKRNSIKRCRESFSNRRILGCFYFPTGRTRSWGFTRNNLLSVAIYDVCPSKMENTCGKPSGFASLHKGRGESGVRVFAYCYQARIQSWEKNKDNFSGSKKGLLRLNYLISSYEAWCHIYGWTFFQSRWTEGWRC